MPQSKLQQALARGLQPDGDLVEELNELSDYPITTAGDARAVCEALTALYAAGKADEEEFHVSSPLHALTALFQQVDSCEAFEVLAAEGLPELVRTFDEKFSDPGEEADDLLFILKVFAIYDQPEGIERIVAAAREPLQPDSYLWSVIFAALDEESPHHDRLIDGLRDPLPEGFIAVAFLDYVNGRAIESKLADHPFDTSQGKARLQGWLASADEEEASYARSATVSLPFVSNPERDQLLALAMDHREPEIQMEAAWASARLGSEGGVTMLARLAADANYSSVACEYLRELGRQDAIPREAQQPDFMAQAEMCQWLAHPQEFGSPPDAIELVDHRVLFWPPTDDRRPVWLWKYRYQPWEEDEEEQVGIGMVGSVTFALFGESTADLSAEDVYALHCCWELQCNEDPRAPEERTVEAGRKLLAEQNPGF